MANTQFTLLIGLLALGFFFYYLNSAKTPDPDPKILLNGDDQTEDGGFKNSNTINALGNEPFYDHNMIQPALLSSSGATFTHSNLGTLSDEPGSPINM